MAIRINDKNRSSIRDVADHGKVNGDLLKDSNINGRSISPSTAHGTYHMANNPNLYEIQRGNNFEFIVYFGQDLHRAGLTLDGDANDYNRIDSPFKEVNAQEVLRMSVSEAFIPHFTQNAIEVKRGNTTIKYAGVPEFAGGDLVLNDYIGADTKSVLMAWQNLSYNVGTERVGLAADYKKKAYLIEYTPDLQKIRTWELDGCWVSALSEASYSSDNADKHQISATITYDKAKLVVD